MPETTRINLIVTEEKKEEWDRHANQSGEYSSLSDLIRTSVAHEINSGQKAEGGANTEEMERLMAEVVDSIEGLSTRFESVETRLSRVETQSQTDPEIENLKGAVYEVLPVAEPGSSELRHGATGITFTELAESFDTPDYKIREALNRLMEETSIVGETGAGEETIVHGETQEGEPVTETRYYKRQ